MNNSLRLRRTAKFLVSAVACNSKRRFSIICQYPCSVPVLEHQRQQYQFNRSIHSTVAWRAATSAASSPHANAETENSTGSTLNADEVKKFERMASSWWDPDGQMKELHSMNRLRVPLIRDGLLQGRNDMEFLLDSPTPLTDYTVLDVGCGGGILSEPLGRLGASVIGIDPGKENIIAAQMHLTPALGHRVSYDCTTIEDYELKNQHRYFDAVVMSEIIEHVDNPEAFIEVAVQLTKVGGSIFLSTLNRTFESWAGAVVAWEYLLRRLPVGTHSWNKFLTPQELQRILLNNGCRVKLIHGMCYNPVTNNWNWAKSTSINYCIHAIRDN